MPPRATKRRMVKRPASCSPGARRGRSASGDVPRSRPTVDCPGRRIVGGTPAAVSPPSSVSLGSTSTLTRSPSEPVTPWVLEGASHQRAIGGNGPGAESGRAREARQQLLAGQGTGRRRPRGEEVRKAGLHALLERDVVVQDGRAVEEAEAADVRAEDVGVTGSGGPAGGEEEELKRARAVDEVHGLPSPPAPTGLIALGGEPESLDGLGLHGTVVGLGHVL